MSSTECTGRAGRAAKMAVTIIDGLDQEDIEYMMSYIRAQQVG